MRAIGGNAEASLRLGIPVSAYMIGTMMVAGGFAGLAGMAEASAIQGRLVAALSPGYGFAGFLVAWLAGGSAAGIVVMAFLFAVVSSVGDILQITQNVPYAVINLLMAVGVVHRARTAANRRGATMNATLALAMISTTIVSGTSLLYATLGELVGERAGIVNLGLEGVMLIGASTGFAGDALTGNPYPRPPLRRRGGPRRQSDVRLRRDLARRQSTRGGPQPDVLRPGRQRSDRPSVRRRYRRRAAAHSGGRLGAFDPLVWLAAPTALLLWGLLFRTRWGLCAARGRRGAGRGVRGGQAPDAASISSLGAGRRARRLGGAHLSLALANLGRRDDGGPRIYRHRARDIRQVESALGSGRRPGVRRRGGVAIAVPGARRRVSPFLMNMIPYLLTLLILIFWGWSRQICRARGAGAKFPRRGIGHARSPEETIMTRLQVPLFGLCYLVLAAPASAANQHPDGRRDLRRIDQTTSATTGRCMTGSRR